MRDSTVTFVVDGAGDDAAHIEAALEDFLTQARDADLKLVVVGGDERWRAVLSRLQPRMMMGRVVQVFALGDDGEPWVGARTRVDSPVGAVLAEVGARTTPREVDTAALGARVKRLTHAERAHAADVHAFVQSTREGTPVATFVLIGLVAVMFGLEWLWGGTEFIPTLLRMGALDDTVFDGEPWRLLSAAWLHAGPLHVLVNAYVLYSLGGFLERLIGAPRLVVLYAAAALGGGLASAALSSAVLSVGASGAIWGLLGASVALAWRPSGLIPDAVLPAVRRNAMVNVVLNLAVSFLPNIDMMAHLGGGIVGAGLVLAGVLTRGVSTRPRAHAQAWLVAAVVSGALLGLASVAAITSGQPWVILTAGQATHDLGNGVTITAPAALGPADVHREQGRAEASIGDPLRDRGALTVVIVEHGDALAVPDELDAAFAEFRDDEVGGPPGGERGAEREFFEGPRSRGFIERYRFDNGIEMMVAFALHPTANTRVEALWWASRPEVEAELRAAIVSLSIP
jgi:membrane associated rhomboid family serine protease